MIKLGQTPIDMRGISKVYLGTEQVYGVPSGYTELSGITFDAATYYAITGLKLKGSDTLRFSFSATKACNVLGCYTDSSAQNNYSLYVNTNAGSYMRYNGGTVNSRITANTRYNVLMTPTGATGISTETWVQKDFIASTDFLIGTTSVSASSSKLDGTIYGAVIVEGRFHGIPVKRNSDNVVGYYDVLSDTFYAPTGSNPTPIN